MKTSMKEVVTVEDKLKTAGNIVSQVLAHVTGEMEQDLQVAQHNLVEVGEFFAKVTNDGINLIIVEA